jgi:hypothetical protein
MHFGAIQDDSGENVSILGGDCIGHREGKKGSYEHMSNSERLPSDRSLNLQIKKTVLMMIKKENLLLLILFEF